MESAVGLNGQRQSQNQGHHQRSDGSQVSQRDDDGGDSILLPSPDFVTADATDRGTRKPAGIVVQDRDTDNALSSHLPSPQLTPSDLRPSGAAAAEPHFTLVSMTTPSTSNGVPTPDPSSDSRSDAEADPSSDSSSSDSIVAGPEPTFKEPSARSRSSTTTTTSSHVGIRRLSASKIHELTAAPESLPVASIPARRPSDGSLSASIVETMNRPSMAEQLQLNQLGLSSIDQSEFPRFERTTTQTYLDATNSRATPQGRPSISARTLSTPPTSRRKSTGQPPTQPVAGRRNSYQPSPRPSPLDLEGRSNFAAYATAPKATPPIRTDAPDSQPPSPIPPSIPLPPMSIPTLLQLELAGQRPSPLYIHQSYMSDLPYESSAVKFERLKNFLLSPWYLERTITFGALACLDAWLWTFTVLPMRFCIAISVLVRWWLYMIGKEARWLVGFVWYGIGRVYKRGRRGRSMSNASSQGSARTEESRSRSRVREPANGNPSLAATGIEGSVRRPDSLRPTASGTGLAAMAAAKKSNTQPSSGTLRHRRTKSSPSNLTSFHKADLLQGALIIFSSIALMNLDASRMYHFIRAQSAIKLYAIYNLLEIGDRLLSALGQDIFECLFSAETLSRNSSGRSKLLLPFGMFLLALVYNILHSVTLFYQVIALNVAVNSYSNALLTLLMSNQFVEIKSSVFKRFEKENTFQLACADIVERFQLWIMLLIIGMRNVVEVGGFTVPGAGSEDSGPSSIPLHSASILPASFTILPSWLWSGEVLSPFFVVIGSEMVVDWVKHAYVNKFNNIKPNFYSRILDILCKDYYTNAFVTPSLTRRLGLPLLPLSCLFMRASVQIYNMFLAAHLPTPLPPSAHTSLSVESATPSPAMVAALDRLDNIIRNALGRAVYGYPYADASGLENTPLTSQQPSTMSQLWLRWTSDDVIAALTMVVVFLLLFLVLLIVKLLLGMVLLRYARDRYARVKEEEHAIATGKAERESYDARGKRVGGYGQIEVGEDRRRRIFADDPEGLRKLREKERRAAEGRGREKDFGNIQRYEMVAKRIW
ncbi:eukaryotic membrane protein family-domain-containing protein [Cercophora scortea]|uniref:Eukaryotic membrane protein family-domain-containing protein n=1 Tax=Cercophora scortea TaxID=314031 RepID=A0AAE0IXE5_9PEZI|nr:eukaryotic membrane protein family-domain-containing protein [Cercophora scortea]